MEVKTAVIIGLGLMGGSLARAMHEKLNMENIFAVDSCRENLDQAVRDGTITRGYDRMDPALYAADLIFICTPVKQALRYIEEAAAHSRPGCIISDICSTKSEIVNYVNAMSNPPCFIGGHPMAGTEKSGYKASFGHMFENVYYLLCPSRAATPEAVDTLTRIIRGIGGLPVVLDAEEHDILTGAISHVPHVIASALVNMVRKMDSSEGKMQTLAAGGFKDITRIASSNPEMWENIMLSNSNTVSCILDTYIGMLQDFKHILKSHDSEGIRGFFREARDYRNAIPNRGTGLIDPVSDIIVDVVDKPGIIGEIATILGNHSINIKNIHVSNSREFENGCLIITLADVNSAGSAFDLLSASGYRVYRK